MRIKNINKRFKDKHKYKNIGYRRYCTRVVSKSKLFILSIVAGPLSYSKGTYPNFTHFEVGILYRNGGMLSHKMFEHLGFEHVGMHSNCFTLTEDEINNLINIL